MSAEPHRASSTGRPPEEIEEAGSHGVPEGWIPLPVEHLPEPTYWPAGLALAISFLFWSLITSWVILLVGIVMFIVSLAGWIRDIRHERSHHARPH